MRILLNVIMTNLCESCVPKWHCNKQRAIVDNRLYYAPQRRIYAVRRSCSNVHLTLVQCTLFYHSTILCVCTTVYYIIINIRSCAKSTTTTLNVCRRRRWCNGRPRPCTMYVIINYGVARIFRRPVVIHIFSQQRQLRPLDVLSPALQRALLSY